MPTSGLSRSRLSRLLSVAANCFVLKNVVLQCINSKCIGKLAIWEAYLRSVLSVCNLFVASLWDFFAIAPTCSATRGLRSWNVVLHHTLDFTTKITTISRLHHETCTKPTYIISYNSLYISTFVYCPLRSHFLSILY